MNALTPVSSNVDAYRASTDAASICKDIVVATASQIQGRHYVSVEGWQAIATAHGCVAAARDVERVEGGVRAVGEVRRMCDGAVISTAEGFVGEDEPTWFGGDNGRGRNLPKRPDYAIRAMAQTRAMSRACRSAFAHVVVMMKAGLQTTPAEEMAGMAHDGDVIEHQPQGLREQLQESVAQEEQKPSKKPLPPGKHTARTHLQNAIRTLKIEGNKATEPEQFEALLASYKEDLEQLEADEHAWWTATEYESVPAWIARRREELDGSFGQMLASLHRCETMMALTTFLRTNEALIDALDDAQRRQFEAEYERRESAVQTMAMASS